MINIILKQSKSYCNSFLIIPNKMKTTTNAVIIHFERTFFVQFPLGPIDGDEWAILALVSLSLASIHFLFLFLELPR